MLGMVKHCMMLVGKIVSTINSHQDLVITADQPVYALGKQDQWMYPDRFKNFVWMMDPLHIEMTLLNAVIGWKVVDGLESLRRQRSAHLTA